MLGCAVDDNIPGALKLPASLAALPFVTALLVRFDMVVFELNHSSAGSERGEEDSARWFFFFCVFSVFFSFVRLGST